MTSRPAPAPIVAWTPPTSRAEEPVMTMAPRVRKFALTAHVTSSVGWLGAVVAYLVLAIVGLTRQDPRVASANYVAMDLVGWWVILPLCLAALATGLIQSLGSEWGL